MSLEQDIHQAFTSSSVDLATQRTLFARLCSALESGEVRAAELHDQQWCVNTWVKEGILIGFRTGVLAPAGASDSSGSMFDKDTLALRRLELNDKIRLVPGGSAVRCGAYVAPGVTIMPPAYINIGAHVGKDSMIDSHALVGSCAHIGARVHLSAAAQIGGVLEPIGSLPVIIEDDVMIGGNCGIYEGVIVRRGAVIGTGSILNASTVIYDVVKQQILRAQTHAPLEVPAGAVVIPGARPLNNDFARQHGLLIQTPIIIKYRDARTDARTTLEGALRDDI